MREIELVRKNSISSRKREGMKINQLRDRNINDHFICFYDEINKLHFLRFVYLAVICWGNFLFRSIDFPYNNKNESTKPSLIQTLEEKLQENVKHTCYFSRLTKSNNRYGIFYFPINVYIFGAVLYGITFTRSFVNILLTWH